MILLAASLALAHDFRPGLLVLTEGAPVEVRWVPPRAGSAGLALVPPEGCHAAPVPFPTTLDCPEGLEGELGLRGLTAATGDVLVRVEGREGRFDGVLHAGAPTVALSPSPRALGTWVGLGVAHVAGGADHLAFLLGLVLLVARPLPLFGTVLAFTLGHSLTLALAALGGLSLPAPPVEAAIAASVALLAVEILRPGPTLGHRAPWAVAAAFGLVHGLGFAGALQALGLPQDGVWRALLGFNLGVELGQVGVVALASPLARLGPAWLRPALAVALGAVATSWTLDRIVAFWGPP